MEFGKEPDIIKNSLQPAEEEFGPNLIRLRVTNQIRELQTVIRDKYVLHAKYSRCPRLVEWPIWPTAQRI